ncbi:hypothetical protein HYDPIDRAFT_114054 [Hydnomerulius pinastri MD-312]|uniref:F-box domain-containing protein n=1 Tax=Hydnomerulius pinastri MD-312 TaxID=994086 RepID=A0A0C9WE10_9AGAM|nr:hypothetical protein HYDPIDRAFT_114054 [Hydnomerulius pinastri MD-312]
MQYASFADLPTELLIAIIQQVPRSTLLSLYRVSRRCKDATMPILYRSVEMTGKNVLTLFTTLDSNECAADAVRTFMISFAIWLPSPYTGLDELTQHAVMTDEQSFWRDLAVYALQKTKKVTQLRIVVPSGFDIDTILELCSFPELAALECSPGTYFSASKIYPFLSRHPEIKELYLAVHKQRANEFLTISLPIPSLSSLTNVAINDFMLRLIGPAVRLSNANIYWERHESVDFGDRLKYLALARTLGTNVTFTSDGWDVALLGAIANHHPHIGKLTFFKTTAFDATDDTVMRASAAQFLSRFKSISHFALSGRRNRMSPMDAAISRDFETVIQWGQRCTTLKRCVFPSGTSWHHIKDIGWVPNLSDAAQLKWFCEKTESSTYPAPSSSYTCSALFAFGVSRGQVDYLHLKEITRGA